MHEHRTIPQRLHDHDLDIEDLRDRIIEIELHLGLRKPLVQPDSIDLVVDLVVDEVVVKPKGKT